ncbi:ankyrin repeat-containing domain protein [Podospora aff. communis PSN243]|uniref:Ankyrin repeat-containing domain protein n=1 Tax=Podospora aff. communis PSN243 TaxID=3040156 RepID=A0AAV9G614_9PEZI|nr:ankyrin repeat-containing domain protein [Podospora aff. communis PSN243]
MADEFYTYKPIDLSTDAIRVLRLHKGYPTDPISCSLAEIFLQDDGVPYEALSYTWGDTLVEVAITLCGRKKTIKDNLYTALHCLRSADEDRWLWVDALCIDQADPAEKTHQVGRMRRIYEKADRVLIWLGPGGTGDVDLLFEMMGWFGRRVRRRGDYRKDEVGAWVEEWSVFLGESGGMGTEFNQRRRRGMVEMLERPWWRRVWIVQEAFNAKRAAVLCGWNSVPTETFAVMPKLLGLEVDGRVEDPLVQSVLEVMPGYLRKSGWRGERADLRTLLRKFSRSEAKDHRDKIYALLGIASDAGTDGKLQADYNVGPGDAVCHAISYFIFGESSYRWICPLPGWNFRTFVGYLDELPAQVLAWAVQEGKEKTVCEVLARTDVNVNTAPSGGVPPLIYLAQLAHKPHPFTSPSARATIFQLILRHPNTDINITDTDGNNALHIMATNGNTIAVATILAHPSTDPNARNSSLRTPLGLAAENGHTPIIESLLQHPLIDIESTNSCPPAAVKFATPLWLATRHNHPSAVQTLLSHGANIEATDTLRGKTPLHVASSKGYLPLVELLLDHGANIEARDTHIKSTPLWAAANKGHEDVFTLLLDRGARLDDNRVITNGQSVLWAAASEGKHEIVLMIVKRGVTKDHLELKDVFEGGSALWIAAKKGWVDVIGTLLDAGADVKARDALGHTALWAAIEYQRDEAARVLIMRGARLEEGDHVEEGVVDRKKPRRLEVKRERVINVFLSAGFRMEEIEEEIRKANGGGRYVSRGLEYLERKRRRGEEEFEVYSEVRD